MADNAIDIITRQVTATVISQFSGVLENLKAQADLAQQRTEAVIADLEEEGKARLDAFFDSVPALVPGVQSNGDDGFNPVAWIKAQAASRAWRTLLQGLIGALIVAAGNAFVQALQSDTFNLLSWDDWKVAITASGLAVVTAGVSYVQNKLGIKPPKVQ